MRKLEALARRALALASRHRLSAWLFLRLLGLVYLAAFLSLLVQAEGLFGSHGILPVERFLGAVREQLGGAAPLQAPTLFWLGSSDTALFALCGVGIAFAVLLLIGVLETPALAALWLLYLSFTTTGQTFLRFQWDSLLLEVGFLALWLGRPRVGWSWRPGRPLESPSPLGLFLVWWLLGSPPPATTPSSICSPSPSA